MNKILRNSLIVLAILVLAGGLVFAGIFIGGRMIYRLGWMPYSASSSAGRGPGMMGTGYGPGMMGNGYGPGMMGNGYRPGMMGNGYGPGMMGGGRYAGSSANLQPLTVDQARQSAEKYLAALNNPDLKIAEVMVFSNNAYVRVVESGTGIGAFELLVDPVSQVATPEPGPDMMWNLKYGGFNHQNMMGGRSGMMGAYAWNGPIPDVSASMTVSPGQALQAAQAYLDRYQPGAKAATDADSFYGYYTIDILRDGQTSGMLSVNGFSGQVFMHTWHGTFVTSQDF